MKHSAQYAHLHIHHAAAQKMPGRVPFCTQKTVDIVLIIASFAGLISAMVFLLTMV